MTRLSRTGPHGVWLIFFGAWGFALGTSFTAEKNVPDPFELPL